MSKYDKTMAVVYIGVFLELAIPIIGIGFTLSR